MKTLIAIAISACLLQGAGAPSLKPGEGLALATFEGIQQVHGEARTEGPLGDLICLPWLRLEGYAWSSGKLSFNCKGSAGEYACTVPKGHGRMDLGKAFERNCRLALLGWIKFSAAEREKLEGPVPARMRVVEIFQPFLGGRLPKADALPALGMEWAGAGDLIRASPESFARWLADPAQEPFDAMFRRYGSGFFEGDLGNYAGWTYVGRAGTDADPCTWIASGQRGRATVLRMPGSPSRQEALRRFSDLLLALAP